MLPDSPWQQCSAPAGVCRRLRAELAVLVVAALAWPLTGCFVFLRDPACREFIVKGPLDTLAVEDPLLDVHFGVLTEPLRSGAVTSAADSLHLLVGHDGGAAMVRMPRNVELLRTRCGHLSAEDLAEVTRAVERLESSVVAERRVIRPGCRETTTIVLRGDRDHKLYGYCGTTPPAEVVRFVKEICEPLGRPFGKALAAGLAATARWAPPVPLERP